MLRLFRKKIGIIGYGNMGQAIGSRIKRRYRVFVFDKDAVKLSRVKGVTALYSAAEVANKADVIILAVKPQDFSAVLADIKKNLSGKTVISIAAGISTGFIEDILGPAAVIRTMPNIGAITGNSLTYICPGRYAKAHHINFAKAVFRMIGQVFDICEDMIDAATATGGSGPGFWGYLFDKQPPEKWEEYKRSHFIPEFSAAVKSVGFDEARAVQTANSVSQSSVSITRALNITPAELTIRVASKGGTTEAGLNVLKNGGTLTEAVRAALVRARELARAK